MAITSTFLGMEVDSVNDDVKDAMGEMANMLAGCVKTSLAAQGKDVKLSIPSAVCGDEYCLECPEAVVGVTVPFTIPEGEFMVELQLQEQA
jgi:chemotaxis protein CheX